MIRIAEKLEFMNARALKVCTKTVNKRRQEPKIRIFVQIFNKAVSEKIFLDRSRSFWQNY